MRETLKESSRKFQNEKIKKKKKKETTKMKQNGRDIYNICKQTLITLQLRTYCAT